MLRLAYNQNHPTRWVRSRAAHAYQVLARATGAYPRQICKWVRVDQAGEDEIVVDGDEEGDEPEDGQQGADEGDEGDAAADGEDAPAPALAGAAGGAVASTTETPAAPTPAPPAPVAENATQANGSTGMDVDQPSVNVVPPSSDATPAAPTSAAGTPAAAPTPAPAPAPDSAATPAAPATAELSASTPTAPASQAATPSADAVPGAASTAQEHHVLPSNAIGMTNTGPSSTEMGQGAAGASSPGIQITRPEPTGPASPSAPAADAAAPSDAMDVDVEDTSAPTEVAEPVTDRDEGLTMGQPAPGLEKLEAQSEDEPREAAKADE